MKRFMSLLLSVIMFVVLVPTATAQAEEIYTEIYTADDLRAVDNNLSGKYKLMNDIDLSEVTAKGGKYDFNSNGWEPIGSNSVYGSNAFTGVFDGNGYTISGMRINVTSMPKGATSSKARIALFSTNSGTIKNLTVSGDVKCIYEYGVDNIGGIAGYNVGTIENCANKCNVTLSYNKIMSTYVGGIAGLSKGDILKCFNNGRISTENKSVSSASTVFAGGITCGMGTVTDSYNTGAVSAEHNYGSSKEKACGIVANGGAKQVSRCYNVGDVVYAIGTVDVVNCYYLNTEGIGITGATALSDENMKKAESFVNFDFDSVWCIDSECGYSYPQLGSNRQVKPVVAQGIEIASLPEKLTYTEGEELDLSGLSVNILYSNGTKKPTEEYTLNGFESTVGAHTITVSYGEFTATFEVIVEEKKSLYILGDADSNGTVNVTDATQIQQYLAQLKVVESFDSDAAEVNRDGKLDIKDVTNIQLYLAKLPCAEGIGEPVF